MADPFCMDILDACSMGEVKRIDDFNVTNAALMEDYNGNNTNRFLKGVLQFGMFPTDPLRRPRPP